MKKIFLTTVFAVIFAQLSGIEAVLRAVPGRPVAGESFMLELTVDSMERFSVKFPELPDSVKISRRSSSNRQNVSIINGRQSVQITRGFAAVAEAAGTFEIPPFELEFNGSKVMSNPLTLTVRDAAQLPDSEKVSAVLTFLPARPVYVGEVMRADIELFIPYEWNLQGIRDIKAANFADASFISRPGGQSPFYQSSDFIRRGNGVSLELQGIFQVLASGEFPAECQLELLLSKRRDGYDPFFAPPPTARIITAKSAVPLKVLPRPAVPAGAVDTGLTGAWQIDAKLSKKELTAGDIAELTLTFTGKGPAPGFKAPEITIPDARPYPPETTSGRQQSEFTVKYPFVALKDGKKSLHLHLAVLDPQSGKYRIEKMDITYDVAKNPGLAAIPAPVIPVSGGSETAVKADFPAFELSEPDTPVFLPLINNILLWAAGILLAGMAVLIISLLPRRKNSEQKAALRRIIDRLAVNGPQGLIDSGSAEIAGALGLPPGTGFAEIADCCPDAEVAEFFRQLDNAAFNPAVAGNRTPPELRQKVVKFLKSLLIFMAALVIPAVSAADHRSAEKAFYAGNYAQAAGEFRELAAGSNQVYPALLYDLGCAEYMNGNHAAAYVAFHRAALLEPWNHKYADALELAGGKLPEKTADHPLLRQLAVIRPDGYILLAAVMAAVICVVAAFRNRIGRRIMAAVIVLCVIFAVSGIIAAVTLKQTVYSGTAAVVVAKSAELSSIPANSGGSRAKLPEGTRVDISGSNGDFVRVSGENISGWMKKTDVEKLFPYYIF
ncbi:MAG: protein BatD [Lentisphaerae bacterium]|nr:protein BatD [Lentisphaerota bacterium]